MVPTLPLIHLPMQAYCHNYGLAWYMDSGLGRSGSFFGHALEPGPAVSWLLDGAGLEPLKAPLSKHSRGGGWAVRVLVQGGAGLRS